MDEEQLVKREYREGTAVVTEYRLKDGVQQGLLVHRSVELQLTGVQAVASAHTFGR